MANEIPIVEEISMDKVMVRQSRSKPTTSTAY